MMNDDCLKLTIYFGERDRARGRFLADALVDVYERHALQASVMLRGIEGFGIKHHLHTARLLTLSEDLPLVSVAVDTRARVEAALPEISAISGHGLITLERARMLTGHVAPDTLAQDSSEATKLTVYCGRRERVDDRSAYLALVERLHGAGVAGATVLLGVDGTARGVRERAKFFGRNVNVPLMIIAVGDGGSVREVIPHLAAVLSKPLMTLESARICKRDGQRLAEPRYPPQTDASGLGIWQKLMIFASEQTRHDGAPLYPQLIHRLRQAGAAGATSLRGIWGYHGDHQPHGERFWALRRQVPVVTVLVDTPARMREWFAIVDELTDHAALVTSEMVPASRALGPDIRRGGLKLAELPAREGRDERVER